MTYEIRFATDAEFDEIAALDGANFGFHYDAEALADARLDIDPERILVTADATRIVAVSAELPMAMAVPGGGDVATTGLTWVSVDLLHRRRGVLRAMIERQLRARAAAGDAAVTLVASEGGIYGRYGFGVAAQVRRAVVQLRRARLAQPVDGSAVQRLVTADVRDLLPSRYERWRRLTPGAMSRDDRRWEFQLLDRGYQRGGRSGLFHLVHPDGYVSYRMKENWGNGDPQHECAIVDYAPVTAEAHAALWQALLSMDLVGSIESHCVPLDDPLPLLLEDPRGLDTTHLSDRLWIRPVDVTALLATRRYGVEVECVIGVRDPLLGDARYALHGGPDGATCARTERTPDLELAVADVGAVSLGGVRLTRIVQARRIAIDDPDLLRRLDRALLADRDPAIGTSF